MRTRWPRWCGAFFFVHLLFVASLAPGQTITPTDTLTPGPTDSPSPTASWTPTVTPTASFTGTWYSPTSTPTPTRTVTSTRTATGTRTFTPTITFTPTATFSFTPNPTLTPPCPSPGFFGNDSLMGSFGSISPGVQIRASRFILGEPATVHSVALHQTLSAEDTQLILAVYGDVGGMIRNKLGETQTLTAHAGWNQALLESPLELNPGAYWLTYMYNAPTSMWVRTNGITNNTLAYSAATFTWGVLPPVLAGGMMYGIGVEPLWAGYCPAPEAFPTATGTPTFTVTDTRTHTPTGTLTPSSTFTDTRSPTESSTPTWTASFTSTPTASPSSTPGGATDTFTRTESPTSTWSFTFTLTWTWTPTPSFTGTWFSPTRTPTLTTTHTMTRTVTETRTATLTRTATGTRTFTPTITSTSTSTFSFTPNPSFTPPCPSPGFFGNDSLMGSFGGVAPGVQIRASRFILSVPVTAHSVALHQTSVSEDTQILLALYSDLSGQIRNKLGETDPVTAHTGWNQALLKEPLLLNPGAYWIAYMYNAPVSFWSRIVGTSTNTLTYSSATFTWGVLPPALAGGMIYGHGVEPIWAGYCEAPEPFPTPTETATATVTSTRTGTFTATSTGTPGLSDTPTSTLSPTWTGTPTSTLSETSSPTSSATGTSTFSPTFTLSRTPSWTATVTRTPTHTFTGTWSPLPTDTPTPTPTIAVEPMTLAQFMEAHDATVAGAGSGFFLPLDDPIIEAAFEGLLGALQVGDLAAARAFVEALETRSAHFRLVEITDLSGGPVYGFLEDAHPGDPGYTGWGAALFRTAPSGYRVYGAPHVWADLHTEDIAAQGFGDDVGAAALLLAGTHRDAVGDLNTNGYSDSDVAHETKNLYHHLTATLAEQGLSAGTPYWFIQVHGAADMASEPDITASNGADAPGMNAASPLVLVDDEIDTRNNVVSGVWGWWEGAGDDQDGDYALRATTNLQGDLLETMGLRDSFMHFEIEWTLRNAYHAGTGAGYDGVLDLLEALRGVVGTGPFPTPTPTRTATATGTATPTETPTFSFTPTQSATPSPTRSATVTFTGTWTALPTDTATFTRTPSDTPTASWTPTATATSSATPSSTSTASDTPTLSPTSSSTPSPTDSMTPTASLTATQSATPSLTRSPTPMASPSLTATPTHTPTVSPPPTATGTPTVTVSPTNSPVPTSTSTPFTLSPTPSWSSTPHSALPTPNDPFILFPNPVTETGPVHLRVSGVEAGDTLEVDVFTTAFRKILSRVDIATSSGSVDLRLDPADFKGGFPANGLYHVRIVTRWERRTLKLIVLR